MGVNTKYLRPLKALNYEALKHQYKEKKELSVESYDNALILPLKNVAGNDCGGVVDIEGKYVELSSLPDRINGAYSVERYDTRDLNVMYCGYYNSTWGHFITDTVSRLWYALKGNENIDKYIFIGESNVSQYSIGGNYLEFFQLLGIADKVEIINVATRYKKVIVPELAFDLETHYSMPFMSIYEAIIQNVMAEKGEKEPTEYPKKIFFTRSGIKKARRYEVGMSKIDEFFKLNGYEILRPETLTLKTLVRYLHNCDEVATFTGSVCHNVLFGKMHQKITIIERYANNNRFQPGIDAMMQLDATYVDANYAIYSVSAGLGPFLYDFTAQFNDFASSRGYKLPKNGSLKRNLKQYIKAYRWLYKYQWYMPQWLEGDIHLMRESYRDAMTVYSKWLTGEKMLFFSDYVNIFTLLRKLKKYIISIKNR